MKKELQQNIEQLSKFPSENPNPVLRVSNTGKIIYFNEASKQLVEFWGNKTGDYLSEEYLNLVYSILKSKKSLWIEVNCCSKVFSLTFTPINDYVNIYGLDITDRKNVEIALKKSEEKLQLIIDMSTVGICTVDSLGNYVTTNLAYEQLVGYTKEELIDISIFDVTHPDDRPKNKELFKKMFSLKTTNFFMEKRYICKDGTEIEVAVHAVGVVDNTGKPMFGTAFVDDITKRKVIENKLIESRHLLNEAQRLATIGSWSHNAPEGSWEDGAPTGKLEWSNETYKIFEIDKNFSGNLWDVFVSAIHPDDKDAVSNAYLKALEIKKPYEIEHRIVMNDGRVKYVYECCETEYNENGVPVKSIGTVQDITERKLIEDALRESELRYRSMMDTMIDPAYICSKNFRIEYMNSAMIKKIGRDVVGEICYKAIYNNDKPCSWCTFYETKKGNTKMYEHHDLVTDKYYSVNCSPIIYSETDVSKLSIFRDITEIKVAAKERIETEIKFQQAQKMESIGTIAGGVAHNFNNVLTIILGYMEVFKTDKVLMEKHWKKIKAIENQIDTAGTLTSSLLGFAKGGKYSPKIYDINKIVNSSLSLFIDTSHEIIVHKYFSETVMAVLLDKIQINQVFLNIYINAMQAMPDGGNLYVTTTKVDATDPTFKYSLTAENYVKISITDEGCGIKKKDIGKIFDPFFTTKGDLGSGMGLASSYGIVKNHNGIITVHSEEGSGTTFFVYLPIIIQNEKNKS